MGESPCSVPEADNFQTLIGVVDPINDPVGTENNFTQFRTSKFRDYAAAFWECAKRQRHIKQLVAQPFGCNGIMRRNIGNNALQIAQSVVGEEYFEIHCGMRLRASSNGMRRP